MLYFCLDLLYSLPWGWICWGQDPAIEATVHLMLCFSPRYHCTIWEKIWNKCKMGRIPWEGCRSNEWYTPNSLHSGADENFGRWERFKLERSLEYHTEVHPITVVQYIHINVILLCFLVLIIVLKFKNYTEQLDYAWVTKRHQIFTIWYFFLLFISLRK